MGGYLFEYKVKITPQVGTKMKTVLVKGRNCQQAAEHLIQLHKPKAIHSAKMVASGYNRERTVTAELRGEWVTYVLDWKRQGGGV